MHNRWRLSLVGLAVPVLFSTAVRAQLTVDTNLTLSLAQGVSLAAAPGQTLSATSESVMVSGVTTTPLSTAVCAIAVTGCPTGSVPTSISASGPVPGLTALSATLAAQANGNSESASLAVTGSTASLPSGFDEVATGAIDLQQLTISFSGSGTAPTTVGVDIHYTLDASVNDQSTNPNAFYYNSAIATLALIDPSTYNPTGLNGGPSVVAPWVAFATAGTQYVGSVASGAQTSLVNLTAGKTYWVSSGGVLEWYAPNASLAAGASLNVSLAASADPTFSIDPGWLAANGYTAGEFTITQSYNTPVPLPAAAWLLLSGLGAVGSRARLRRSARA